MSVTIERVSKRFGRVLALDDVSFEVPRGSLTALLGPSGSGKSTLLRAIAGLEAVDEGRIVLEGREVTHLPAGGRDAGFVFQHYALFPHLSVAGNIAFPLQVRKKHSKRAIAARVAELLGLIRLEGYETRRPHELSGGQRQRVALARALAAEPSILLLDEPFGALDAHVRKELRRELQGLHERTAVTTILETHDAGEAMELADRVLVLREGVVQQYGPPRTLYAHPANPFVLGFLGEVNLIRSHAANAYVRPSDLRIESRHFGDAVPARVRRVVELGARTELGLTLDDGQQLTAHLDERRAASLALSPGALVYLEPTRSYAFDWTI